MDQIFFIVFPHRVRFYMLQLCRMDHRINKQITLSFLLYISHAWDNTTKNSCMHAKKRVRERELEVKLRLQVRSKFVNPSKATRFSCSWQQAFGSNGAPLPWTILSDMSQKHFIFLSTPWPLLHIPSLKLSFHFNASSSIFTPYASSSIFTPYDLHPLCFFHHSKCFQMDMHAFDPLCSHSFLLHAPPPLGYSLF